MMQKTRGRYVPKPQNLILKPLEPLLPPTNPDPKTHSDPLLGVELSEFARLNSCPAKRIEPNARSVPPDHHSRE